MKTEVPKSHRKDMLDFASYCHASYSDNPEIYIPEFERIDEQFKRISTINQSGMFVLIIEGSYNVVAFRGTDEMEDWLTNLKIEYFELNYPILNMGVCAKVHMGFYQKAMILYHFINDRLEQHGGVDKPMYVTGHSLGGALAEIYTLQRLHEGKNVQQLYTFGAPRTMDWRTSRAFDRLIGKSYYRVVNKKDPVPHVPSKWRFRHSGQQVYIDRHQACYFHTSALYQYLDGLRSWNKTFMIRDHDIKQYMEALSK